jgi:hypothetical protein
MAMQRNDVVDVAAVADEPLDYGLAAGAMVKRLASDDETLANHVVITIPPNWVSTQRGYFVAGMDIYMLSGDLAIGNHVLRTGSYSYLPAGMALGQFASTAGCRFIAFNAAAQAFVPAERSRQDADEEAYVANNLTFMQPWKDPMQDLVKKSTWKDPETGKAARPAGVVTKTLRRNDDRKELVALTAQVSGFIDPGTEVHPHNECLYLVSGDAFIGHTYDNRRQQSRDNIVLGKDHYISRPPGIYHGPVTTQNGTLWLIHLSDGYTGIFGEVEGWEDMVADYMAEASYI